MSEMRRDVLVYFLGSSLLGFGGLLNAQPKIVIGTSPNPLVVVTPITDQTSVSGLAGVFTGLATALRPASFLIANNTKQPIVGLVVVWLETDSQGKIHTDRSTCDSFSIPAMTPVVKPGSRMLVGPGGIWLSETQLPAYSQAGSSKALQQKASQYLTMSQIKVQIDAMVFANGEVDGPDMYNVANDLSARKQAAVSVVAAVDAATASGESPNVALTKIAQSRTQTPTGPMIMWQRQFAQHALTNPNYVEGYLRKLPSVPALFSTSSQTQ